MSDEIRDDEAQEEVEGHGFVNDPAVGEPSIGQTDDEKDDDVEAHGFINKPSIGDPSIG
ncbi:MAG TPA: hypothetical protein VH420_09160 [Gaiellaceae bacterium]